MLYVVSSGGGDGDADEPLLLCCNDSWLHCGCCGVGGGGCYEVSVISEEFRMHCYYYYHQYCRDSPQHDTW